MLTTAIAVVFGAVGAAALTVLCHGAGIGIAGALSLGLLGTVGPALAWAWWASQQDELAEGIRGKLAVRIVGVGLLAAAATFVLEGRHLRAHTLEALDALGLDVGADPRPSNTRTSPRDAIAELQDELNRQARVDAQLEQLERALTVVARGHDRIPTTGAVDILGVVVRRWDALEVEAKIVAKADLKRSLWLDLEATCRDGDRRPRDRFFHVFDAMAIGGKATGTWSLFRDHPSIQTQTCELRWIGRHDDVPIATACMTGGAVTEGPCPDKPRGEGRGIYGVTVRHEPGNGGGPAVAPDYFVRLPSDLPDKAAVATRVACDDGTRVLVDAFAFPQPYDLEVDHRISAELFGREDELARRPERCSLRVDVRPEGIGIPRDAPWTHLGDACLTPTGVTEGRPCEDLAAPAPDEPQLEVLAWSLEPDEPDAEGRPRAVHRLSTRITAATEGTPLGVRLHCSARREAPTEEPLAERLARAGVWVGHAAATLEPGQSTVIAANDVGRLDGPLEDYACRIELVDMSTSPPAALASTCPEPDRCPRW